MNGGFSHRNAETLKIISALINLERRPEEGTGGGMNRPRK